MRFAISANPTGGIRVIGEIPDLRLCRLEGQNGIGKSLAVRLLQLVTGDQPWAGLDSAWGTLRDHLGEATIVVDRLRLEPQGPPTGELTWLLNSRDWSSRPSLRGVWNDAQLNGKPISVERVREILRVFRIAGDESLAQSLAVQIRRDSVRVQTTTKRVEETRGHWDERLRNVEGLLGEGLHGDLTARSIASLEAEAADLVERLASQTEVFQQTEKRRELLEELASLVQHRQLLVEELPALLKEQSDLAKLQETLRAQVSKLDEQAAKLRSDEQRSEETATQLTRLESLYEKRRERHARRMRSVNYYSRQLGIQEPPSPSSIFELRREAQASYDEALQRRRTHDRVGMLLEIADHLEAPLTRGQHDGFGAEVIAIASWNALTIDQLETAVSVRRDELVKDIGAESKELQARISGFEQRLRLLSELANELRLLDVARSDIATVRSDIDALAGRMSSAVAEAYRSLVDERASVLDKLVDISAKIGELDRKRADLESQGDLDEVNDRISHLATQGLDVGDIQSELASTAEVLSRIRNDIDGLRHMRDRTVTALEGQYANVSTAAARLRDDGRFNWLAAAGFTAPAEDDDVHRSARQVDSLRLAARQVGREVNFVNSDLLALNEAMTALADRLDHELPAAKTDSRRFSSDVVRYYQTVFTRQLASRETRDALFDKGTDVGLNLTDMTTSWTTPSGERRTRPLEAFSSGQRAFAYTRVQLEALRDIGSLNKVAFLDEFGAYVARDRLDELMSFIERRALRDLVDQVVVILPLSTVANDAEQQDVESRSYFTRDILSIQPVRGGG